MSNFCFALKLGSNSLVNFSSCDAKYNAVEYAIIHYVKPIQERVL
ncbi:MAG: hypothetical protein OER82_06325 [Nitrosopumilus sp.]|nr:hypothetical protein [Nitrosopumilus sp.]MDH3780238.1 hypothetical protein [Nitrosopumilus sp.]